MRTYLDAKAMAKALRARLQERQCELTHAECLELVAHQFGLADWNVLAARIGKEPDTGTRFDPAIPVIRIFSVEKAKEFYVDYLGFRWDWEHRFEPSLPLYAQVSRSGLKLHLSEHHGDASPGAKVFVEMKGVDAFHRELSAKQYNYLRPGIKDAPWDARTLEVLDPFSNRIVFNESKTR